jgi:predicted nuclease of restriction endonuclease-like RecB superfamily
MTRQAPASTKWQFDPGDEAARDLVRQIMDELLPFDGRPINELEAAVMELNLHDAKEAHRRLRSELAEAIVEGRPLDLAAGIDPSEMRVKLFSSVWEGGLSFLTTRQDLFGNADEFINATARHFQIDPQAILENLYADTPGERRASFPAHDSETLAEETIRAVNLLRLRQHLRRALGMTLVLPLAAHHRSPFVSIFWLLKREGLMYDGVRSGPSAQLSIAGPYALFEKTTAYGNRLFAFTRSLFFLRGAEWTATVDILRESADRSAQLSTLPLRASMRRYFAAQTEEPAVAATRSGDEEAFRKYFEKLATAWSLAYEGALVPLDDPSTGAHRFMVPDFVARHNASDKEVLIELVGYWRPEYLQRKLSKVMNLRGRTIILLVNRKLLLGREETATLEEAGVRVLHYSGREELKEAARVIAAMLEDIKGKEK